MREPVVHLPVDIAKARRVKRAMVIAARIDPAAGGYFARALEAAALAGMEAMLPATEAEPAAPREQHPESAARADRAPRPMLPVLTFTVQALFGREEVTLGAEPVGELVPQAGDHYAWRVILHGVHSAFRHAESQFRARSAVVSAVDAWLERLGIFYPGLEVDIRIVDASGRRALDHAGGSG